ncbi:uncharacterized protein Bfra_007772 [Botrytis fragariae]|uniref:Uncharacterized protein n=1 Tax=Botrytis fragariae TaxID=1964551 RepID=A0A8H6APK7_9HELO|nr:uncharacterized protein Bfra_007772 [Botrytis fragariae]KAF5871257.1 hypothetical protein Bfra_007772 [Botrytis fragariae]
MKSSSQPYQIVSMFLYQDSAFTPPYQNQALRSAASGVPGCTSLKSISVEPSYQPARRRPSTSLAFLSYHPSPGLHNFQLEAHSHSLFMQGCEVKVQQDLAGGKRWAAGQDSSAQLDERKQKGCRLIYTLERPALRLHKSSAKR